MNYNKNLKDLAREKRNNSTLGEVLIWKNLLSKRKTGYQFNRQFPIDNYIVDFISRELKLIIEIDGYSHQFKHEKDIERDEKLQKLGYSVIRFSEKTVRYDFNNVIRAVNDFIYDFKNNPPAPFTKGE